MAEVTAKIDNLQNQYNLALQNNSNMEIIEQYQPRGQPTTPLVQDKNNGLDPRSVMNSHPTNPADVK